MIESFFKLVETYQVHAYSGTCWKYNNNECRYIDNNPNPVKVNVIDLTKTILLSH